MMEMLICGLLGCDSMHSVVASVFGVTTSAYNLYLHDLMRITKFWNTDGQEGDL
jgi:hypothetical protein